MQECSNLFIGEHFRAPDRSRLQPAPLCQSNTGKASQPRLAPMIVFPVRSTASILTASLSPAKARAAGVPIEPDLRGGQPHDYAAMPTPEGREARAIILRAATARADVTRYADSNLTNL